MNSSLFADKIYRLRKEVLYYEEVIQLLDKQPTAYDVDNVVSKIRRYSGNGYRDVDGDYVPPMIEIKYAIEIIREGSVHE